MELDELKKMWSIYDQKLERNWQLNLHLLRRTNLDKMKSKLGYLVLLHAFSLAFCIPFIILYISFVISHIDALHFVIAGAILCLWTVLIAYSAIDQLRMIMEMDYAVPIVSLQKKLVSLRLVMIKYLRLSLLILPFYTVHIIFWFELIFDFDIYQYGDQDWWISQIIIGIVVFVPLTIWLFRKLSPAHVNTPWVRKLISGSGGKQIAEALDLMDEIEKFKEKEYTV